MIATDGKNLIKVNRYRKCYNYMFLKSNNNMPGEASASASIYIRAVSIFCKAIFSSVVGVIDMRFSRKNTLKYSLMHDALDFFCLETILPQEPKVLNFVFFRGFPLHVFLNPIHYKENGAFHLFPICVMK